MKLISGKQIRPLGRLLAIASLLAVMALLSACESVMTPGQNRSLYAEVYETRRAVTDVKTDQGEMLRRINDLLIEMDKKLNSQDTFMRETKDDLQRQIRELQEQTRNARTTASPYSPAPTTAAPAPDEGVPPMTATSQEEQQAYDQAKADADADNHDAAIQKLNQFLTNYPNSAKAADALYLLGQAQFEKRQFEEATRTFERIPTQYPAATTVIPLALHAQAVAEARLNQNAKARATLERLKQTYPDYNPAAVDRLLKQIPNQ